MSLVQNFTASTSLPNQIALSWTQPLGFNTANSQIIITRTDSYFPCELFNPVFPTKTTDTIPIPIFTGSTIVGTDPSTVTVSGNVLTDSSASFPTSPMLVGRLLRDTTGAIYQILGNTSTTLTLNAAPSAGIYVVLADFPTTIAPQQNYERDIRTTAAPGTISNLVQLINGALTVVTFVPDALVNLIFQDGSGNKFIVQTNTANTLTFFESSVTPVVGTGMTLLSSSSNNVILPFIDTYQSRAEAASQVGTGLLDDQFYYYTAFTLGIGLNVAQAEFALYETPQSTQSVAISTKNNNMGTVLYNYWPGLFRQQDATGDLQDLMDIFGFQFQELYSLIKTFNLQDSNNVYVNALVALADQTGLPSVGYSIGIDTLRRIAREMLTAWKLKASKEGIALFIRIITTWDITGGTGDINDSISDFLPNIQGLRFFSSSLGLLNTRLTAPNVTSSTNSSGVTTTFSTPFVPGGRFIKTLPGIIIPGFFTFREFVVTVPNVALFIGTTTNFTVSNGTTTISDSTANFGANNSLVGNYILPNESDQNDIFVIISNTSNSVTVSGILNNREAGGTYVIMSPLNANRFIILTKLMPLYRPANTLSSFRFT